MDFLRAWTLSISGAVIIGAIAEMLMPEGDLKKYVRLILGVILIVIIVQPISQDWGQAFFKGELTYQSSVANISPDDAAKRMNDQVVTVYRQQLASAIQKDLSSQIKGYSFEVQPEIENADPQSIGGVTSIAVMLTPTGGGRRSRPAP